MGVLITGATGFLGRHVLALGRARGVEVHALGRNIEDAEHVRKTVAGLRPEGILHLAATGVTYGAADLPALLRTNAGGLTNLLSAAAELPSPPPVVCAGSGFEYAPLERARRESDPPLPNSAYGASKVAATAIASFFAARLPITVLRLFSLYGRGEPAGRLTPYLVAKTRAGEPVDLTAGEQLRDYTEASDAAEAFWRALETPPATGTLRVLNTASGHLITLRHFCEKLADALRDAGYQPDLRFGARPYREDEMMDYTADVTLLRETLRWQPATPLEQGLRNLLADS